MREAVARKLAKGFALAQRDTDEAASICGIQTWQVHTAAGSNGRPWHRLVVALAGYLTTAEYDQVRLEFRALAQ